MYYGNENGLSTGVKVTK